jgi:tRNA G46 methylase TrmB
MRQRKIKNIEEKIDIFSEPLVYDPASHKGLWRGAFGFGAVDAVGGGSDAVSAVGGGVGADGGSDAAVADSGADRPLYLEIGCGKGRFITVNAMANPDSLYLGFEGHQSVLYRALQRAYAGPDVPLTELNAIAKSLVGQCDGDCANCRRCGGGCDGGFDGDDIAAGDSNGGEHDKIEGNSSSSGEHDKIDSNSSGGGEYDEIFEPPGNLRLCAEYILDMRDFFVPGELSGIFLNFSDPWPKSRQQKRRLTSPRYLDGYADVLADGGFLRFKTDNADFFAYSVECIKEHPRFEVTGLTNDLHGSEYAQENVMTEYERRYLNLRKKINYIEAVNIIAR